MKFTRPLVAAAIAALSINAHATQLTTDGAWYEFDFNDVGSSLYDFNSGETSFSFTLNQAGVLRVVDSGFSGDQFAIVANGTTALGNTSAASIQDTSEDPIAFDGDTAWNSNRLSKGEWSLLAGTYTITGTAISSPLGNGYGFMSVTAVPEPESYAMLLAGLGLMGVIARRRNRNV